MLCSDCSHAHMLHAPLIYMHMYSVHNIPSHLQLNLHSLRDQFVRTEERSFNSSHKWMGVRVRSRTKDPTEVRMAA